MRFLRAVRAVLWSLFGVRRRSDAMHDLESAPVRVMVAAVVFVVAILVVAIASLVHFLVIDEPRERREQPSVNAEAAPRVKQHGPVQVHETMEARVAACTACHSNTTEPSRDGFSPRLAGKPAGYLFNQLVSFRDGQRSFPPMVYVTQNLSEAYLREIAEYFSGLDLPYPPPEPASLSPEQAVRARRIIEQGDPARGVPACADCHGRTLAGIAPSIPGILGLPRQYIIAQFGVWRSGKLRSVEPDCMGDVARRLAPDDAPLLAAWLAAQPAPAGMKPEEVLRELPLQCGSVKSPAKVIASDEKETPGAYLAAAADCVACHTSRGGARFAGGRAIETPFGTVYSTNITPDVATGIGAWSREDFRRALHDGRSKDGRLLYPAFPYQNFTKMTQEDVDAIFGYLRGVPPVSRANTLPALRFPYSTQGALGSWRALFFRAGRYRAESARGAEWNRGAYLVQALGHCDACHTARNVFGAPSHSLELDGGLIPMQKWYAPSLVYGPVPQWKTEEIMSLLKNGIAPHASAMGPMAEVVYRSTQHLSDADTRAIATYLQSSTAETPSRKPLSSADPRTLARGAAVYGEQCAQCHGDDGKGAFPAYPALAGNPGVTSLVAANAIKAVLQGGFPPATAGNPRPYGMPPYAGRLSDADIAAVLTYVRSSWGNDGAPVSTVEMERYR